MSEQCPNCRSIRIGTNNYGKKTAGVIGASAGTYGGYAAATAGAQAGAALGIVAGPVGAAVGGISGALIGALLGGATGASAGVMPLITASSTTTTAWNVATPSVLIPALRTIFVNFPRIF